MIGDQTFTELPAVIDFYRKHFLDTTTLTEHVSILCYASIIIIIIVMLQFDKGEMFITDRYYTIQKRFLLLELQLLHSRFYSDYYQYKITYTMYIALII